MSSPLPQPIVHFYNRDYCMYMGALHREIVYVPLAFLLNFGRTRVVGALRAPPRSLRLPGKMHTFIGRKSPKKSIYRFFYAAEINIRGYVHGKFYAEGMGGWVNFDQLFASSNGSLWKEMLLCSCNQFYARLDRSARHEWLLRSWNQFCASLN